MDKFERYAMRVMAILGTSAMMGASIFFGRLGYEALYGIENRLAFRPALVGSKDLNGDGIEDIIVLSENGSAFSFIRKEDGSYMRPEYYLDRQKNLIKIEARHSVQEKENER